MSQISSVGDKSFKYSFQSKFYAMEIGCRGLYAICHAIPGFKLKHVYFRYSKNLSVKL